MEPITETSGFSFVSSEKSFSRGGLWVMDTIALLEVNSWKEIDCELGTTRCAGRLYLVLIIPSFGHLARGGVCPLTKISSNLDS